MIGNERVLDYLCGVDRPEVAASGVCAEGRGGEAAGRPCTGPPASYPATAGKTNNYRRRGEG